MIVNAIKIQRFRANDLVDDGGKQFELGRSWCDDFFVFNREDTEVIVNLIFKPLNYSHERYKDMPIELKLAEVSKRGDRKAYGNGENGRSQIKNFFINDLHLSMDKNSEDYFAIYKTTFGEYYLYFIPKPLYENFIKMFVELTPNVSVQKDNEKKQGIRLALQQIYYGAPGTGKSYEINDLTKAYSTIRTTFHPDSDYSTFVGAYKPTMEETPVYGAQGFEVAKEKRITYAFVKQAFLKAYLGAWQKYANGNETAEPQFLVIEEINRGNCAQIFGDLFQLLDRSDNGFSTYPIEADSDLQNEIKKAFAEGGEYAIENGLDVDDAVDGYTSNYGETLSDDIKNGRVLLLPNNLYIWATMNTSDQSLFPIDSAFKRRWDWRYVKIADAGKGWKIRCGNEYCDWWKFVEEINKRIAKETSSDDKKLGYFFCKPPKDSSEISEEKFVGKVLFYLWNDVFKDGDISLFKVSDEPEAEICFDAFYGSDNKVNIEAIRTFLVGIVGEENIKTNDDTFITVDENGNAIDYTKYSFDGKSRLSKKDLGYSIVMKYISEHSDKTFAELQSELAFDDTVDNKYRYKGVLARTEEITGSYTSYFGAEQTSSDGVKYKVLTWWNEYNIDFIIKFAKAQGWAVNTVTE
ncbi:AAA family ATPase [uncultured Prevotella sp.]|uniref:AAA family ATPase n=1 Tax=uncultured Prevotella sp. TaxID=159272 RepID=UPI0028061670|nr:AAA family ATPase [uncultured Prevotella sp.]